MYIFGSKLFLKQKDLPQTISDSKLYIQESLMLYNTLYLRLLNYDIKKK